MGLRLPLYQLCLRIVSLWGGVLTCTNPLQVANPTVFMCMSMVGGRSRCRQCEDCMPPRLPRHRLQLGRYPSWPRSRRRVSACILSPNRSFSTRSWSRVTGRRSEGHRRGVLSVFGRFRGSIPACSARANACCFAFGSVAHRVGLNPMRNLAKHLTYNVP